MSMTHSAYSRASAYAVHQVREMGRYHGKWCEKGVVSLDDERASRNASELDSASLHELSVASLPEVVKPAPGGMKWGVGPPWTDRGDWRQRARKGWMSGLGRPYRESGSEAAEGQASCGNHNHGVRVGSRRGPYEQGSRLTLVEQRGRTSGAFSTKKGVPLE